MAEITFTNATQRSMADDIVISTTGGATGALAVVYLGVGTNAPIPTPTLTLADIDEPTFPGYERKGPVVWSTQYDDPDGLKAYLSQLLTIVPTDGTTPETAQCAFLATAKTAGALEGLTLLDQPFPFLDTTTGFHALIKFGVGDKVIKGEVEVVE